MNEERRDPVIVRGELECAKDHVRWVMKLCATQAREGRYFLFEHSMTATSWFMPEVEKVARMDGVQIVKLDMCAFGMVSKDEDGIGLVKKLTSMKTSSPEVGKRLDRRCCNKHVTEDEKHRHVQFVCGRPFVERCVKA